MGVALSEGSVAARGAGYRTVARTSQVDETLFGRMAEAAGSIPNGRGKRGKPVKAAPTPPTHAPAVVAVSRNDMQRMMGASPVLTTEQALELKRDAQAKRDKERAHSNARKAKMLAEEAERAKRMPPTETEVLKQRADLATMSRADRLLAEQQDEVKHMNQMMLYSKCVTIRDAQLEERKHMMLEEEDEGRRLDRVMEVERLKALDNYEERERQRKAERLIGAQVLQEQLAERQAARVRAEEAQQGERAVMMREMERLREADVRANAEKQRKAKALVADVLAANEAQIARKREMQTQERQEEARIAEYNRLKALREEEQAAEKERIAREKDAEVTRLRAAQERAADKQSELDELRARRHAEAAAREWRAQEAARASREQAILDDLNKSRQAQKGAKLAQQAEMAKREVGEFERILKVNNEKEAQERSLREQVQLLRKQHQKDVLAQIANNAEKRKVARQSFLEEGRLVRKDAAQYVANLEAIKQSKLAELRSAGVPEKYCAELARFNVGHSG